MPSCASGAGKSRRPALPSRIAAGIRRPPPSRWRPPSPATPTPTNTPSGLAPISANGPSRICLPPRTPPHTLPPMPNASTCCAPATFPPISPPPRSTPSPPTPPSTPPPPNAERAALFPPSHVPADIAATLLYPVTDRPFRELYEMTCGWSDRRRAEVIDVALASRTRRDEILGGFRGGLYAFDMVIDVGAYRDLHRHRRCQKFRQAYSGRLGFETPALVADAGAGAVYQTAMQQAFEQMPALPAPGAHYLLPFGARFRFLFKMDFAEAEYMSRLRSGVKGHFSYREVACQMKQKMEALEPELGRLIDATPPWVEDPLKR